MIRFVNKKYGNLDLRKNRIVSFLLAFLLLITAILPIEPVNAAKRERDSFNNSISVLSDKIKFPVNNKSDLKQLVKIVDNTNQDLANLTQTFGNLKSHYLELLRKTPAAEGKQDAEIEKILIENKNEEYAELVNTALEYRLGLGILDSLYAILKESSQEDSIKNPESTPPLKNESDIQTELYDILFKFEVNVEKNLNSDNTKALNSFYNSYIEKIGGTPSTTKLEQDILGKKIDRTLAMNLPDARNGLKDTIPYLQNLSNAYTISIDLTAMTGGGTTVATEDKALQTAGEKKEESKTIEGASPEESYKFIVSKKEQFQDRIDAAESLKKLIEGLKNKEDTWKSVDENADAINSMTDMLDKATIQANRVLKDLADAASATNSTESRMGELTEGYRQIMPDIFDQETGQLNKEYLGLFAWTANFTPFVTNIYDSNNLAALTDKELALYNKYSDKRSMVYMAVGDRGIAKGIRSGTPYQYKPISLAEFIDKADDKEMLLFIRMKSFEIEVDEDSKTGETTSSIISADTGDASEVSGEGTKPERASDSERNASVSKQSGKTIKQISSMPWKLVNGSVTDPTGDVDSTETAGFVGPIYASSGKSYKEMWSLDDTGTSSVKSILNTINPKKQVEEIEDSTKREEIRNDSASADLKDEKEITKFAAQSSLMGVADRNEPIESNGQYKPDNYEKKLSGMRVTEYNPNTNPNGRVTASGAVAKPGTVAVKASEEGSNGINYNQYKDKTVWVDGYGYGKIQDNGKLPNADFDVFFEAETGWGNRKVDVYVMPDDFVPEEYGNPKLTAGRSSGSSVSDLSKVEVPKEDRYDQEGLNTIKKKIFEGINGTDLADNSIARFTGNTMNMNYFLLHNNLMTKRQYSNVLEDDLNSPLYTDFLGNILTQSGYVVVPAAANYNYYNSPVDLPMFNASFLNSYPDLILNETQLYTNTSSLDKQKFIYQKNKQGLVTITSLGRDGKSQVEQFKSVPLASRTYIGSDGRTINFMDDITMFKPNVKGFFRSRDTSDSSNNLTFVNSGAIFQKFTPQTDNTINMKNISNNGQSVEWNILKEINKNFIDVDKSYLLNQELLTTGAVTTELSRDGDSAKIISNYISKDEQLKKENSLTRIVGELFESITMRIFTLLDSNYMLYTPTPASLPFGNNAGQTTQKVLLLVSILAFIIYLLRFFWNIFTRDDFGLKSSLKSMLVIILIGASSLFVIPMVINILYNVPSNFILRDMNPIYVMEGVEQNYREQDPTFFDTTGYSRVETNPSITLEKLKSRDIELIRKEAVQTPVYKTNWYIPSLDNSKLHVLGDVVYIQGNEMKMDVKDLFNIVEVQDKPGEDNLMQLDFTYSGYGEISNYMPFMQIGEAFTDNVNKYTAKILSPYRIIQYRKGLTKSTGRVEDYIKSIVVIAPDLLDSFASDLMSEYYNNANNVLDYYNKYTMPEDINKAATADDILGDGTGGISPENKEYKDTLGFSDPGDNRKYIDVTIVRDALDYINMRADNTLHDWLGIGKVLQLESADNIFPWDDYKVMREAKWFPKEDPTSPKELYLEKVHQRIDNVNERTRKFVVDKIIPISSNISDDTAIKIISLYATMEFNREFSDMTATKLYPTHYNTDKISNFYTSKVGVIPQSESFITGVNKMGLYLARETGSPGLILAGLNQIGLFIRMIIRIAILSLIIITLPYVCIYIYAAKKNRYNKYLFGTMTAVGIFAILYVLELYGHKLNFYLINNVGQMEALTLMLIPNIFITYVYIAYLKNILLDMRNFGFNRLEDVSARIMGNMQGIDINDAYDFAASYDTSDYYGNTSYLGSQAMGTGGDYANSFMSDYSDYVPDDTIISFDNYENSYGLPDNYSEPKGKNTEEGMNENDLEDLQKIYEANEPINSDMELASEEYSAVDKINDYVESARTSDERYDFGDREEILGLNQDTSQAEINITESNPSSNTIVDEISDKKTKFDEEFYKDMADLSEKDSFKNEGAEPAKDYSLDFLNELDEKPDFQ